MRRLLGPARWLVLTGALGLVELNACTLLSGVNELDDGVAPSSAEQQGEGGSATPSPTPGEVTPPGTVLGGSDAAADHKTTPFDAAGFPLFDASPVVDAADGSSTNYFLDDFNRAAGDPLGNNWVERAGVAFVLENNAVRKANSITRYRDNIVYRPPIEDALDVETRMEIRVTASPAIGNPQLWARVQNVGQNVVTGYHVYLDDGFGHFHVGRHIGAFSEEIAAFDTDELVPGEVYRLVLQVTGTDPSVRVYARMEEQRANGTWRMLAETGTFDNGNQRVRTKGGVGFSADRDGTVTYDNFERILP
jgi:hypothetical protein